MSRADEIRQGLRDETGALTFPLDVLEYSQGFKDFKEGNPPPKFSSASYDLGRNRARERQEHLDDFIAGQKVQEANREKMMRDLLKDHPEALAEYLAKIAAIRSSTPKQEKRSGS